MRKLKTAATVLLFAVMLTFLALCVNEWQNGRVRLTEYTFSHKELPEAFNGYKLLMISDIHDAPFSGQISDYIRKEAPDMVVICGDMVQLPNDDLGETLKIAEAAGDIPVYAVSGNHERQGGSYEKILKKLRKAGVIMLENDSVEIKREGESILLAGIKDPRHDVVTDEKIKDIVSDIREELPNGPCFSILLSHRADIYPGINDSGVDLILSGHLHGGIIRLPFFGGIIGKNCKNSLLPDYEYGVIQEKDAATMIVSGGCDKNPEKKRYFNPPEVVLITLQGEGRRNE